MVLALSISVGVSRTFTTEQETLICDVSTTYSLVAFILYCLMKATKE